MPQTSQNSATCAICGNIYPGESLPAICPQCGSSQSWHANEKDTSEEQPSVWRCKECGFIHYGPQPPEFCPVCGFPASQFEPLKKRKTFIS